MSVEHREKVEVWDAVPGFDLKPEIDLPEMHSWCHVANATDSFLERRGSPRCTVFARPS